MCVYVCVCVRVCVCVCVVGGGGSRVERVKGGKGGCVCTCVCVGGGDHCGQPGEVCVRTHVIGVYAGSAASLSSSMATS